MKQAEHSTLRLPFKELSSALAISETAHMLTTKHIFDCFAGVMHKVRGTEDVISKRAFELLSLLPVIFPKFILCNAGSIPYPHTRYI